MGLFASRPEEPSEWAGLPAEPRQPESEAERLSAAVDIDPAGLVGSGLGSIVIPVEPVDDAAESPDDSAIQHGIRTHPEVERCRPGRPDLT